MWYTYLNRNQLYMRSYRTHNLWLDQYMKKIRTPRVHAFHIGLFKRMGKTYSGARVMAAWWGFTFFAIGKFLVGFSKQAVEDKKSPEVYNRLISIFQKNQYGYHTRIMSDFDMLLDAVVNERFIDDSSAYYDDPVLTKEIEDTELGLQSDFSEADVKHLLKDKDHGHHDLKKCFRYPDRFGTNYDKTDDLSIYKVVPKGQKPIV
jgi:hypothetical protein